MPGYLTSGRSRIDLLAPHEVAELGDLELTTAGVVEGFLAGMHRSPFRGFSVEFAEHRPYQAGDELRYVDWRVLARADRLTVKQYEAETNLRAMILLDVSKSMDWRGAERRLTKLDYARRLAAAIGLMLLRQRDATGLVAFDEQVRVVLPARARAQQRWAMFAALTSLAPGGGTAAEPALVRVTDLLRRRGMVVFVSDLLFDPPLALRALRFLRHRGHEVMVLHIMDPAEWELEGPPEARFEDPETGVGVVIRPREFRAAYHGTVRRAVKSWSAELGRAGISYAHITTDTAFGPALRRVLDRRQRSR